MVRAPPPCDARHHGDGRVSAQGDPLVISDLAPSYPALLAGDVSWSRRCTAGSRSIGCTPSTDRGEPRRAAASRGVWRAARA
eukprot:5845749-Prymnesium_polylepis.1